MSDPASTSQAGASGSNAGGSRVGEPKSEAASVGGSTTSASRDKTWTVLELLKWTTDYFRRNGIDSARLDAEVLLAHALEIERLRLYIDYEKPVLPEERDRYRALVQRRAQERVPVSQLLGEREFWSLPFKVSSDVLTPRPETETLVEYALSKALVVRSAVPPAIGESDAEIADPRTAVRILDIGTGSGAIALSLASELPDADITATDLSEPALQIAAENADHLHT